MENFELKIEQICPSGEFMVIDPIKGEGKSKSGIILSNVGSVGATPTIGKVLRKGELAKYEIGSTIMFRRYSVDEIPIMDSTGGKTIFLIENGDVLCEIKNEASS